MINSVVLVSGVHQSDSVIHIHVSILFQILKIIFFSKPLQFALAYMITHWATLIFSAAHLIAASHPSEGEVQPLPQTDVGKVRFHQSTFLLLKHP